MAALFFFAFRHKIGQMKNSHPDTLVELLKQSVSARPSSEVVRFKQEKQWTGITGERLAERVRHVALGLYELGIRKGDRVAILAESGPLWTISDYAILSNGAVNVPIYPTQAPHQVEYILRESEPKLLFISTARQMKRVDSALSKFTDLRIVSFQPLTNGENVTAFSELEASGARFEAEHPETYD